MIKKITSIVLVATMAFSLTACAGKEKDTATKEQKKEVSAYEILSEASENSSDNKSADSTIEIDFAGEVESKKVAVKGSIDLKANAEDQNVTDMSLYAKADASVTYGDDSQDIKGEAYIGDDVLYFGGDSLGGWMKLPLDSSAVEDKGIDIEEYSEAAANRDVKDFLTEENIDKYFDNTSVEEKEVAGVKCYSVKATVDSEALEDGMKSLSDVAGEDVDVNGSDVDVEICVTKDTKELKYIGFDVKVGENELADISKCFIGVTYNSFDVDSVEVPEDVKSSALDFSSMLSSF